MSLQSNEIEVTTFSLDHDGIIPFEEGESWLSDSERERADRFRFGVLRDRYVRGRATVRKRLSQHLRCHPQELSFGTGEHGKPFLLGEEIHFNLSHSIGIAVLAISQIPSIGIDIEKFDREVDFDRLAERCFRPVEWDRFRPLTGQEKAEAFFWIWTAKEARMKATGEGFGLEPKSIEIEFSGSFPRACLEPRAPEAFLSPVQWEGMGAACTVAALSPFRVKRIG